MSKFLLALDQATKTTGFALYKDGKLTAYGSRTFKGTNYMSRINQLRDWVKGIIQAADGELFIAIEDIQLQANDMESNDGYGLITYKTLSHLQGVLLSLFEDENVEHTLVLASSWKHTCGIKGKKRAEQKKNAQKYVLENFGISVDSDTADAICIGQHVLNTHSNDTNNDEWLFFEDNDKDD